MFFIILFGGLFLLALVIAVLDEVRFQSKLPKRARHWSYGKTERTATLVHKTEDLRTISYKYGDRSERTIGEALSVEHLR